MDQLKNELLKNIDVIVENLKNNKDIIIKYNIKNESLKIQSISYNKIN